MPPAVTLPNDVSMTERRFFRDCRMDSNLRWIIARACQPRENFAGCWGPQGGVGLTALRGGKAEQQ